MQVADRIISTTYSNYGCNPCFKLSTFYHTYILLLGDWAASEYRFRPFDLDDSSYLNDFLVVLTYLIGKRVD